MVIRPAMHACKVAGEIKQAVSPADIISRYGEEEIAVILRKMLQSRWSAEKIRSSIERFGT